jgi:proteasome lid subunit RPN8/RPN11
MFHPSTVRLESAQNKFLDKLVEENKPFETCALLLGKKLDDIYVVKEIVPIENTDSSNIRFTMQNEKLLQIYAYSEGINLSVIGIFHSHPSEALPSKTDKVYMQLNPVPWIIKSTTTNEKRCFILNEYMYNGNSEVVELEINIKD